MDTNEGVDMDTNIKDINMDTDNEDLNMYTDDEDRNMDLPQGPHNSESREAVETGMDVEYLQACGAVDESSHMQALTTDGKPQETCPFSLC